MTSRRHFLLEYLTFSAGARYWCFGHVIKILSISHFSWVVRDVCDGLMQVTLIHYIALREQEIRTVVNSVLDAIKLGIWDFEPENGDKSAHEETPHMPGSTEKLEVLAKRVASGKPLWHPDDRISYDERD